MSEKCKRQIQTLSESGSDCEKNFGNWSIDSLQQKGITKTFISEKNSVEVIKIFLELVNQLPVYHETTSSL